MAITATGAYVRGKFWAWLDQLTLQAWDEGRAEGRRLVERETAAGRGGERLAPLLHELASGSLRPLALARGRDLAVAAGLDREQWGKWRTRYAIDYLGTLYQEVAAAYLKADDRARATAAQCGLTGRDWLN